MDDTNSLIEQRKAKLAALRARGIDPFKNKFAPAETCAHAREHYAEGREVALAGRITAHRDMGKSMFMDIRDQSGRIQIYAQKNVLGDEQWNIFTHLDLADFIGVDVCLHIMEVMHRDLGDPKFRPCPLLRKMVDAGQLGRKSAQGFHKYQK